MKTRLVALFEKKANWKNVLLFFALQVFFNVVILPSMSAGDARNRPILDLQFFYTPAQAYAIISAYAPAVRQTAALMHLTLDIIYPLVYGTLLSLLLVLTWRRACASADDNLVFLPWLGVLFDYLENIGLASLYLAYPARLVGLAWITAALTAAKWTAVGASFVLIVTGGVKLVFVKR